MFNLLQLPRVERTGTESKVLIVRSGSNNVGVEVDGVGERLDVLLRPMTGLLSGMRGVLGTALLGDGRVLLVLDLPELTA
jgi:two-component system chemotaxis sensor kinase CheA